MIHLPVCRVLLTAAFVVGCIRIASAEDSSVMRLVPFPKQLKLEPGQFHVNPRLEQKGLAVVFNPLDQPVKRTLKLPLYYTGLSDAAMIRREDSQPVAYKLDRQYTAELPIEMMPRNAAWFVAESQH